MRCDFLRSFTAFRCRFISCLSFLSAHPGRVARSRTRATLPDQHVFGICDQAAPGRFPALASPAPQNPTLKAPLMLMFP